MRAYSLLAVGFISLSAVAGPPCDDAVDLRGPGRPLDGLENIAQGYEATNLCGFFTFSQYLDSWRVRYGSERGSTMNRASAVAIGVDHAIMRDLPYWLPLQNSTDPLSMRLGRWGSTFCSLARAVRDEGYCADESLPSRTVDATARFSDAATATYGDLLRIAETPPFLRAQAIERGMPKIYERYAKWASERGMEGSPAAQVRAWIEAEPERPYRTIRAMFFPKCANASARKFDFRFESCAGELYVGLDVTGLPIPNEDPLRKDRAAKRVHELLGRTDPLPVPFAYCGNVLVEGKKYSGATPLANCGLHWSLIAGRKNIGGECHLLVRNTWPPTDEYSPDWKVEGGDIWVREKELLRSTLLVQWLE
jgi:hypothetical protein